MPALITHRLFGEEALEKLPDGIVSSEDERIAFLIANQGPDPFFFRVRTLELGTCMELGRRMHRCRITRQFDALRDGVSHLQKREASLGRAFVLGLLSHYVLDRTAHPFVYAQQWGIQKADESLAEAGSQVHAVIESDLDVLMLQLKRDGATVADCPPAGELLTNERINRVAGVLTSFMARHVYGIEISVADYGRAVADMQLAYHIIEPQGAPLSRAVGFAEGLLGNYSLLDSLAHRVTDEPPRRAGNLDHLAWENPFTSVPSNESFPEVFDRALGAYARAASSFVGGDSMARVTEHVNYSGRVLDASEEFDREE